MRESQLPIPNALNSYPSPPLSRHRVVRVPGLVLRKAHITSLTLFVLIALIALPATAGSALDSSGVTHAESDRYRPRPSSIWVTPAAGRMGETLALGGNLHFATASGWVSSIGFTYGEELCLFCNHVPIQFGAGAVLAGVRGVSRFGYASIAAGPDLGWEERPDKSIEETLDDDADDCSGMFCMDTDPRKVTNGGLGAQVLIQAALAEKYFGIGGQIQMIYIPNHVYAGVSVFFPIGLIK